MLVWLCCLVSAFVEVSTAQTLVSQQSDFINRVGSILIYYADGWRVSAKAPNSIGDGINLTDGVPVQSLHLDTLKKVIGNQNYGWAEISFLADNSISEKNWLMRHIGHASIRIWLNGREVFNDGKPSISFNREQASALKKAHFEPVKLRNGMNYFLIEYSWNRVPQWMYEIKKSPQNYLRPVFSTSFAIGQYINKELYRTFLFGTVSFVLFLFCMVHLYLALKAKNSYYQYAFGTNLFLLLHVITQMSDYTFQWSMMMLPVVELGHVIVFPFVMYNIIFTIGSYYNLSLPKVGLRFLYGVFIIVAILATLFQGEILLLLNTGITLISFLYALYLLRKTFNSNQNIQVYVLFSGLLVVLLGAFIYSVFYRIVFPETMFFYYISATMVYLGIPISFTTTIALDFGGLIGRLEQKVDERTQELQEKDEFKSRFFLNVSHELRTPIAILDGLLQKAVAQHPNSRELRISKDETSMILRNAKRLSNLVNQILEITKSDNGVLTLQKEWHHIDELVLNVIELNRSFVELRGQVITFLSNTENLSIYVDSEKISTIISNILINASKYGPDRSRIVIESRMNNERNEVEIDVKDEGEGVLQSDRELIFHRFHRIEQVDKPYVEGLGVGLELSRSLAKMHDGDLILVDEEEKGARFRLVLPVIQEATPVEPDKLETRTSTPVLTQSSPIDSPNQNVKISLLLVEDNPDMREFTSGILREMAMVHTCKNGNEALIWLRSHTPDMVITDLMMPEMSGEILINTMAKDKKLASIPIIVVSAKDDIEGRLKLLRVGIMDYLTKPFNPEELQLKIENLMRFSSKRKLYKVELPEDVFPDEVQLSQNVKNYILEHIDDSKMSSAHLAEAFAMSERNFYRKIEKDSGMTPAAFIREVRLQYAARLVETSKEIRLNELARKVGYKSSETFKRNYIDRFGVPPK